MSQELSIRITAEDGASKVFRQISDASAKVADSLQQAGTKGAQGLKQTAAAAGDAQSRISSLRAESTALGAVLGVMAAGAAKAGAAFRDQQRSVDAINRLYGDSAKSVLDYADSMQELTNVSDDAARQSAILMNTLQQNYQLSGDQIEQLIMRSADLAELHGKSFLDVSQMVQNALRGEAEYIEQIGVTLNDNFVAMEAHRRGIEGWTTTMTDAEKAAFRFQLLMEQTASAQGYAMERADSANGFVRGLVNDFQDATQAVGGFLGPIGQVAAEMAPIAIAAPIAGAGIGRMVASLKESATAAKVAQAGLTGISAVASPLGLVLTGVVAIGGLLAASWLEQRAAAQEYNTSLSTLDDTLESVRRRGDTALADLGKSAEENLNKVKQALEAYNGADLKLPDPADYKDNADPTAYAKALTEYEEAVKRVKDQAADAQPVLDLLNDALTDPNINAKAYLEWANGLLAVAASTEGTADDLAAIQTILSRPLSDFAFTKVAADLDAVKAKASEVKDVFADLPATLDDLRIDGKGALADQLDSVHKGIIEAFTPSDQEVAFANRETLKMLPAEDQQVLLDSLTDRTDLSTASAEKLDAAWDRIQKNLSSGNLDNAKVISDVFAILNDTSLDADEKVAELEKLSLSMSQYIDKFAAMKDAQVEWLANGDNFLNWWKSYQQTMLDASGGVTEAGKAWEQFRKDVDIADAVQESGQALDQVLRTFQEIDSLGQRSASAGSIADTLIGAPGESGALQDLWDRIAAGTSSAVLAQEDYNNAITAGIAIQESNVRVQDDLNVVRAKQMPLLAQEQAAYEANIDRISQLNAVEARRVLMLQDTAVQSQVAALYSQAYAAAIGEVPKDVTTKMILEAAEADAGLKDLLLNLGLIQQNSDGTISVNFPDAESVGASIDRVTLALLSMQAAAEHKSIYEVAVELYGEDEARRLLGLVDEADGKTATMNFTVISTGVDEAGNNIETIQLADGTQVTVVVGVTGLDQLGKADSDIKAVTLADGTVVTVKTDVDTTGWENSTFGEIIANGKSVEVETTLKPPTGWSVDDWNNSDGEGSTGGLPDIEIGATVKPVTETPAYEGAPVEVPATIQMGNPTVGDGTGGPLAGLDGPSQQIVIDAVLQGTAQSDIQSLVEAADQADGKSVTMTATANVASAVIGIQNVQTQADTFGATSVSATLGATDNASGTIQGVIDLMGSFESKTVTLSVVTSYSTIGTPPRATEHGGLIGYANGGLIPHIAAEGDRAELAHYANGGVAVLPREDIYLNPPGTYISPAPANPGIGAGGVAVNFYGSFYGSNRAELNEWAANDLLPAIAETVSTRRRQLGG